MPYTVSISHVDTCFPEYLTDHHNREGELLVGVYVDQTATNQHVVNALVDEIDASDGLPEDLTDEQIAAAIKDEFDGQNMTAPFDNSLEPAEEGEAGPQAWFLLTWSKDD